MMKPDFSHTPVLAALPADLQESIRQMADERQIPAGQTLFAEGDSTQTLYMHLSGKLMLSRDAKPIGEARSGDLLDWTAALGSLPHTIRAIALTDCTLFCWSFADLLNISEFEAAARRELAFRLMETQTRLHALEAPIHMTGDAQLLPGPFVFNNTTLILAFCDADLDAARVRLPEGLSLLRLAWRKRDALFLAMAVFRDAHPEHHPDARFSYTETTYFVPVRCGARLGLYPAWIYPSTYEPILLGREIYGFPKRLGYTLFPDKPHPPASSPKTGEGEKTAQLIADGETHLTFIYRQAAPASEPRLIRALSDWLGVEGRFTETAFRVGDVLLDTMQIGLRRRVSVYNHKRIPAANTHDNLPVYAVDQLTQAVFTVTKWHTIDHLPGAALTVTGGDLRGASVTLREAYLTRLDMRLSTGRVVRNYANG